MPEITDMESLTAWLETRPREDAITIVHRVAMRVAPIWYAAMDEPWAGENDLTSLPVLRSSLISGAARENPAPEIIAAAHAAFIAARAAAIAYATATSTPDAAPAPAATVAADAIAYATSTAISFTPAPFAGEAAYPAAYATAVTAATTAFWPAVQHDARAILDGHDPLDLPLWPATNPLADEWTRSQPILRNTPGGAFWIDWYQRALDGRPQNWPLLRDVALIDDDIWQSGGDALDAAINSLREKYALAAAANGERVEPNPDTGLLRLVPVTELPEQVAEYARRKIIKAVEVFDGIGGQQYGALAPDLTMLRRAVTDAGNLPVELYDAGSAALRRLHIRITNGDCPDADHDPLIADYQNRLREAANDIRAADPETQRVLERRAAIAPNDALIEARDEILAAVEAAGPVIEGRLADTLPQDAETATDPTAAPEDRAAASFRLSGRLLRIVIFAKGVRNGFIAGNAALAGTAAHLKAMEYLANSPVVKAIFRSLGL